MGVGELEVEGGDVEMEILKLGRRQGRSFQYIRNARKRNGSCLYHK
jgi:hypothetical protein